MVVATNYHNILLSFQTIQPPNPNGNTPQRSTNGYELPQPNWHQRLTHTKQISPLSIPMRDGFKAQYQYQQPIPQTTTSAALAAGATNQD